MSKLEEIKKARIEGIKEDLVKYGIEGTTEVVYNPSYDELFKEETLPTLEGFEKGVVTELGAVNVMTGVYTGRSPKDKFIVLDENSKDNVWWTTEEYKNDNKPASQEAWTAVKDLAKKELSNASSLSTVSAVPTKTLAWLCASSWKWHGRLTS